jgi:hypothetical protein
MSNMHLFDGKPHEIKPAEGRVEPAVWIRRLRLVEDISTSATVIRDIEFRRGLNIICTARARPEDRRVVGHSVGKTLLLRLIRYCLGEQTFSTRPVRSAITAVLERAHVLAEVHVAGRPWVIARPIGLDIAKPPSWALEGDDFDRLLAGPDGAIKFPDFVSVLEQATASPFGGVVLPHADRQAGWLDLVAWLSRDQECRFRHQSEWRDPDSESRTAQLQIEDASLVMRMAMDLLGDEEKKLQVEHRKLLADKKTLATEIARLELLLDAEEENLRRILQINGDIRAGELFGSTAGDAARAKQNQLQRLLEEREADKTVEQADGDRLELVQTVARLQQQKAATEGKRDAEQTMLEQLEQADTDSYYASFATLGQRWCRLYPTEANAKAKGCPGAPAASRKPGEKDPEQSQRIADCRQHIASLQEQLTELEQNIRAKSEERGKAQKAYQDAFGQHVKSIGGIRQQIGYWQEVEERAKRYGEWWSQLTRKQSSQEAIEKKIQESNEKQRAARAQLNSKRSQLSRHFDYVLKTLISPDAGGEVILEARGVIPQPNGSVAASGQALSTSAMVLGFDFACLIAYITGLGHLPGLFLHDSPREADMEDTLYHRLFDLAAHLETVFSGADPSFQYIVTTTTPPPDDLDCDPYVRLRLDARQDDSLLLRRRLAIR